MLNYCFNKSTVNNYFFIFLNMKHLFLSILVLFLWGCNKKQLTFTLQGQIFDLSFNAGLKNAVVSVYEVATNGAVSDEAIGQTTTDENGLYSVTFDRHSATKYIFKCTKENYFEVEKDIPFDDLSTETANVKNYFTYGMSWVKLSFKNTLPSDASDQLRFIKQEGKEGCAGCCPDTERYVNGTKDSVFYCITNANTTYSYFYMSVNPSASGILQVMTIPFDTVEIANNW